VTIGSGVTSIGSSAFSSTNLKKTIWLGNTPPSSYTRAAGTVNYVANDQYSSLGNKVVYPFLSSVFEVDGIRYVPISLSERTCDAIDCVYDETSSNTIINSTVTYQGINMTVKEVRPYVCYGNNYIQAVEVDYAGAIPNNAFSKCSSMTNASIGNSVTSINDYSFSDCSSLQTIKEGDGITALGKYAFSGCSNLGTAVFGNNNESLSGCFVGPMISKIEDYAFYGCNSIKMLSIKDRDDELTLGSNGSSPLFSSCPLDSVYIGGNISYSTNSNKGYSPFYRNTSLRSIYITDKETEIQTNEFYGCTSLQNVWIGDGVISIGDWAFSGCRSLNYFAFGTQLTSIGKEAFSDCASVNTIISKASTPPACGSQALDDINKWNCKLVVPDGCLSAYQAADQWKEFVLIEEETGGAPKEYQLTYIVDGEEYKTVKYKYGETITPEAEPTKEGYTFSGWSEIPETMPANDVTVTGTFTINKYKLTYIVDGEEYKVYEIEYGDSITAEAEPTKEYYTFSGWSEIPETMPANDVTITGTFTINKYKLVYQVDGEEYKSFEVEYGAPVTPEAEPKKEGYTFSGWSEIPETMPGNDVIVTGTFAVNKYKLTYMVDGEEYKVYDVEYGAKITAEAEPTKEHYTFSGWSEIPETMPAKDVTVTGSFTINKYKLVYLIDGEEYKSFEVEYGAPITPEAEPQKEGYTFSGWSEIPETMPGNDVIVTGTFAVNKYKLTYMVDGEEYKSYEVEYGATITPEAEPTKEGYTFSGWGTIPGTMPANDVVISGSFTKGAYKITYVVDGETYKTISYDFGDTITPEAEPAKEGYTFSGWSEIPETMPANDLTVTGTFTVNKYKLTYIVDGEEYKSYELDYGTAITPEAAPTKDGYVFSGWSTIPETMPANDVTITGTFSKGAYKLIYMVDGAEYKSVSYDFGDTITPEAEPTKEGYTFSGWSEIPETMPGNDVIISGTFTINVYKLTYMVDGVEYKSYDVDYGTTITPEPAPTKDGYVFSGWSTIPETMPANDVIVMGSFTKGAYKITYIVDGETYKTVGYDYGDVITPEAEPTKEGYTFSGWSDIPATMPANDIIVTGTFTVNKYKLTYVVDGVEYKSYDVEYGTTITPEAEPTKEGYTFSGWSDIPETMPAHDVTITGAFTQTTFEIGGLTFELYDGKVIITGVIDVNGLLEIPVSVEIGGVLYDVSSIGSGAFKNCVGITSVDIPSTIEAIGANAFEGCTNLKSIMLGKGIKEIGSKAFAFIGNQKARTRSDNEELTVYCDAAEVPTAESDAFEGTNIADALLLVDDNLVTQYQATAPWSGFGKIVGKEAYTGIDDIRIEGNARIYDLNGNRLSQPQHGVNIFRMDNGTTKKVIVK